ncbi:MAG TPA: MBL fold metallo-hydrolase [Chloroflexota bacterium]|jgi:L-ascorbate metabolism protein UlaG (beta-lactamase superfamily)|nr:MBL fold metallo-hydrolase [Chloroflexota bacterium]
MSGLELWWLGQSGFRLRDPSDGPVVFIDPFLSPRQDRAWQAPVGPEALAQADLVLSSHEHIDHLDRPSLKEAASQPGSRFTLVVPRPLLEMVTAELGLPNDRVVGAQPDQPLDLVPGVRVHPVPARHGINVADAYTLGTELSDGLVRYLGFVVEVAGVRVYHAGDCIPYDDQVVRLRALRPHVALLPINGRDFFRESDRNLVGNMDAREAAKLASDIGAQVLVPMHWELFAHNRGFPRELVGYTETDYPELTVLVMGRGARLVLTMSGND